MTDTDTPGRLAMPPADATYRVVQWATGRIGAASLKGLVQSSQFDVVGAYVHSPGKEGQDAGTICGLGQIGVIATRDIEAIIALKPDCIVAMPEGPNVDDMCRFLEAGINVATSRVDFLEPLAMDQHTRERIEAACREGRSSIHATGSSPGFSSEALPLLLTSMSREVESITIDEYADIPASCPDIQVTQGMGFGQSPGRIYDPAQLEHHAYGFRMSMNTLARSLGITLDRIEVEGETANANNRFLLPGGTPIEKGHIAATRVTITAFRDDRPFLRFRINWHTTLDIDTDWEMRKTGWRAVVQGATPIEAEITFPVSPQRWSPAMAENTANRVINSVPYVCAAEPGIRTVADLPTVVPHLGRCNPA